MCWKVIIIIILIKPKKWRKIDYKITKQIPILIYLYYTSTYYYKTNTVRVKKDLKKKKKSKKIIIINKFVVIRQELH